MSRFLLTVFVILICLPAAATAYVHWTDPEADLGAAAACVCSLPTFWALLLLRGIHRALKRRNAHRGFEVLSPTITTSPSRPPPPPH